MKKIIISIILLNITVLFYSIYFNKPSNNYFAINDDITQVDDTNEETDNSEDLLDDDKETILEDNDIDLAKNYVVFNRPNVTYNEENIKYLRELFGLSEHDTLKIQTYDGLDLECEDNCKIGTGMRVIIDSQSNIEDSLSDSITEDEFFGEDGEVTGYEESYNNIDDSSSISSDDEESSAEDKSQVIYHIIVVGDITGDGEVQINDIIKSKNKEFINKLNKVDSEEQQDNSLLFKLYKRALNIYNTDTKNYIEVTPKILIKSRITMREISNILHKPTGIFSIKNKKIKIGAADTYKINVESEKDINIEYESEDKKVAIVDDKGKITARKQGETNIIVKSGDNKEKIEVEVKKVPRNITFNEKVVNMVVGMTYKNVIKITPSDVEDKTITYTSSDSNIVSVDNNGTIKALKEGNCTISATTINNKIASYNVVVTKDDTTFLSPIIVSNMIGYIEYEKTVNTNDAIIDGSILVNGSFKLTATSKYNDGSAANVIWKSGDEKIATINQNGEVTTKKVGKVTLFAFSGKSVKSYTIIVCKAELAKKHLSVDVKKSVTVNLSIKNGDGKNVSISGSNIKIEGVDSRYYSYSIDSNNIMFTGIKQFEDEDKLKVLINNLNIGEIILTVNDPSKTTNGSVMFLPTQYGADINSDEAILLKSQDGSLALVDTGDGAGNKNICSRVISYLHKYAGVSDSETVQLEYLILSHEHRDHVSCLKELLNNSKIKIKNIIAKKQGVKYKGQDVMFNTNGGYFSGYSSVYNFLEKNSSKYGYKLKNSNNFNENEVIKLGNSGKIMKIHLFNVSDIYSNVLDKCMITKNGSKVAKEDIGLKFVKSTASKNRALTTDNKYIYLKNANSTSINFTTSSNNKNYYYGYKVTKVACGQNANSIVVLAEVSTGNNNDPRYIYIPSDLENNGYPFIGRDAKIDNKNVYLTGYVNYFYKHSGGKFSVSNGNLQQSSTTVNKAREYRTALSISKTIDKNKIVIYQASHHGYNNDKASLDVLNLNRSDIYGVTLMKKALNQYNKSALDRSYINMSKIVNAKNKYYYTGKYASSNIKGSLTFNIQDDGSVKVVAVNP